MQTVTRIVTLALLIALTSACNDSATKGPEPTVELTAASLSIGPGGATMLSWSSTDAALCTASGAWSGRKPMSGSESTGPLTETSTFTLRCDGDGGTVIDSVTIAVSSVPLPPPTVTLNANPTRVASGGSTELTWSSTNASSCTASGGWGGNRPTSGTQTISNLRFNTTFTLDCIGAGGTARDRVSVSVAGAPPEPTVTLSANPTTVSDGGSSVLTWSSTDAASCLASGGWVGTRPTDGSETVGPLSQTSTFTLTCTGPGGGAVESVTVTVLGTPVPTVTLSANPATVNAGGSSVLTWSSTNAASCVASGAWNGARATNGSETVGPLSQTSTFTLSCTGSGGSAAQDATVTVSGGGNATVQGQVDSSFVDIFGDNRIYVFSGNVTPDDMDGDSGDPVVTLPVTQDANACTFHYAGGALAAGTYTIAFTQDAANDRPGSNDDLVFAGTRTVSVSASGAFADLRPDTVLQVGPGRLFANLRAASAAATNGSVIEIDAGTYDDDITVWRQNNVVIRGVGGRAHIRGTRVILNIPGDDANNGLGLLVTRGDSIRIENMEFSQTRVLDGNGAGIRVQSNDLSVCNGSFHDNENGILGGGGTLVVEYSEFNHNGLTNLGSNHNIDVVDSERFIFRHNYSHHVEFGDLVRTRAHENHILYNRLMDETTGTSNYNIELPEGGLTFIIGNLLQQGPGTNNGLMVGYGTERLRGGGRNRELYLVNNTLVNDAGFGDFVQFHQDTDLLRTINNLFVGNGSEPSDRNVEASTNLVTNAPGLLNQAGFDYHLTLISPARDAGSAPGTARGVDLNPIYQYRHPAGREARVTGGNIDIGAYEFAP